MAGARNDGALRTYVLASAPGWIAAATVCLLLNARGNLPWWGATAIVVVVIAIDLVRFPARRRYYTSEPAETRIIGEQGVAASDLTPRGFVRVHGELWQAEALQPDEMIREGDRLQVRGIHGLELIVDRDDVDSRVRRVSR